MKTRTLQIFSAVNTLRGGAQFIGLAQLAALRKSIDDEYAWISLWESIYLGVYIGLFALNAVGRCCAKKKWYEDCLKAIFKSEWDKSFPEPIALGNARIMTFGLSLFSVIWLLTIDEAKEVGILMVGLSVLISKWVDNYHAKALTPKVDVEGKVALVKSLRGMEKTIRDYRMQLRARNVPPKDPACRTVELALGKTLAYFASGTENLKVLAEAHNDFVNDYTTYVQNARNRLKPITAASPNYQTRKYEVIRSVKKTLYLKAVRTPLNGHEEASDFLSRRYTELNDLLNNNHVHHVLYYLPTPTNNDIAFKLELDWDEHNQTEAIVTALVLTLFNNEATDQTPVPTILGHGNATLRGTVYEFQEFALNNTYGYYTGAVGIELRLRPSGEDGTATVDPEALHQQQVTNELNRLAIIHSPVTLKNAVAANLAAQPPVYAQPACLSLRVKRPSDVNAVFEMAKGMSLVVMMPISGFSADYYPPHKTDREINALQRAQDAVAAAQDPEKSQCKTALEAAIQAAGFGVKKASSIDPSMIRWLAFIQTLRGGTMLTSLGLTGFDALDPDAGAAAIFVGEGIFILAHLILGAMAAFYKIKCLSRMIKGCVVSEKTIEHHRRHTRFNVFRSGEEGNSKGVGLGDFGGIAAFVASCVGAAIYLFSDNTELSVGIFALGWAASQWFDTSNIMQETKTVVADVQEHLGPVLGF